MLPITIIILDSGIFEYLRLIGKESAFNKHGLAIRQKPATNTPRQIVGVGPGNFANIHPVSLLVVRAEYPTNLEAVMERVTIETMQVKQYPFFWELFFQCLIECKLKHLVT
jgi:hypothetical protein